MAALNFLIGQLLVFLTVVFSQEVPIPDEQRREAYWKRENQNTLRDALRLRQVQGVAKNVVFFLGDGMGISTVTATRIFKGQLKKKNGEEELLVFDEFPYVSLSKTYGIDRQTSDSANTATAFLCGVKANFGTVGLDGRAIFKNCSSTLDPSTHVSSILKWAQKAGKWTGFVTTMRVTHATPAALYAHSASRQWEAVSPDPNCKDIAQQLVQDDPGKNIRVIMGGGFAAFLPENRTGRTGRRKDSKDLLDEWLENKKFRGARARIIVNAEELNSLNPNDVDYLMGIFSDLHMPFVSDIESETKYPSLSEMTEKAIQILSRNPKGFFLFVEGGNIDTAHHMNLAQKALVEGVEFDKAVGKAVEVTDVDDTLIVVTADHSHAFTLSGDYPLRGTNILGLGGVSDIDNKTITTLGYHNGPGYKMTGRDRNLTQEEALDKEFLLDAAVPMSESLHGAEDVAVYARGPMAHLFHGVHDQSYIPYAMGYASCVGPHQGHCNDAMSSMLSSHWTTILRFVAIGMWTYVCSIHTLK